MKTRTRSLYPTILLGVLILVSIGILFVKDFYQAIISGFTTQMHPCTLIGCGYGLGIAFEGNLGPTLTVKFTNPEDQSSFTIHCGGRGGWYGKFEGVHIIPFTHPTFTAISQFLPPESLCQPGSKGNAAALIGEDNVLGGLAYSCNDQSALHYLKIHHCDYDNEGNAKIIGFYPYNYYPDELIVTVYLPEETYITTIKPEYKEVYINGKDCPPTCLQNLVHIYLPFPQATPTVEVP